MTCEFCNYIAKNQQALSAHYRGCAIKKLKIETEEVKPEPELVKTEPEPPAITQIKVKNQLNQPKIKRSLLIRIFHPIQQIN